MTTGPADTDGDVYDKRKATKETLERTSANGRAYGCLVHDA